MRTHHHQERLPTPSQEPQTAASSHPSAAPARAKTASSWARCWSAQRGPRWPLACGVAPATSVQSLVHPPENVRRPTDSRVHRCAAAVPAAVNYLRHHCRTAPLHQTDRPRLARCFAAHHELCHWCQRRAQARWRSPSLTSSAQRTCDRDRSADGSQLTAFRVLAKGTNRVSKGCPKRWSRGKSGWGGRVWKCSSLSCRTDLRGRWSEIVRVRVLMNAEIVRSVPTSSSPSGNPLSPCEGQMVPSGKRIEPSGNA